MIDSTFLELADDLALGLKALGDATRLRILATLADGSHCVCEIQEAIDIAPNLLSHHLKVLREAGLIEGTRRGRWIDDRLAPASLRRPRLSLPPDPAALGLSMDGCTDACARQGAPG